MKNDAIQTRSRTAARTVKAVGNLNFFAGSSGGGALPPRRSTRRAGPLRSRNPPSRPSIRAEHGAMRGAWRNHLGDSACGPRLRRILTPRMSNADDPGRAELQPPNDSTVEFLLRFARIAHRAGYPTSDLEERLGSLAAALGLEAAQISATPTLVELSFGALPHQRSYTLRVRPKPVDLDAIARLEDLARDVIDGLDRGRRARPACRDRCPAAGTAVVRRARGVRPRRCRRHAGPGRGLARGHGGRSRRPARRRRGATRQTDGSGGADDGAARSRRRELQRRGDRSTRPERVARHRHAGRSDHIPAGDVAHDRRARDRDGASAVGRREHRERRRPAPRARVRRRRGPVARGALVRDRRRTPSRVRASPARTSSRRPRPASRSP